MALLPKLRPSLDPCCISEPVDTIEVPSSARESKVKGLLPFKSGLLAVLEDNERKLFIYNHKRSAVLEFSVPDQYTYANQIAFDRHNNIIIAQGDQLLMLRINMNGKVLPQLHIPGWPTGVACSPEGDIFVSSNPKHAIYKLAAGELDWVTLYRNQDEVHYKDEDEDEDYDDDDDEDNDDDQDDDDDDDDNDEDDDDDGEDDDDDDDEDDDDDNVDESSDESEVNEFDPELCSLGQMSCGSDGELFVATNKCIIVLDTSDGKMKRQIGCDEYREGKVRNMNAIFVTGDGYLFVTDMSHYVHVFRTDGQYLSKFGGKGDEPGKFTCPWRITVDWNGYLIVSDIKNGTIQVF